MLALGGHARAGGRRWPTSWACPGGERRPASKLPAVILAAGDKRVAFVVDEFLAEQEVVVKSLGARPPALPHVSGGDHPALGADRPGPERANLVRTALGQPRRAARCAGGGRAVRRGKKRILVADDSVTTRTLEKSILEAAGYEVAAAADGAAAWQTAPGARRRPARQRRGDAAHGRLRADRGGARPRSASATCRWCWSRRASPNRTGPAASPCGPTPTSSKAASTRKTCWKPSPSCCKTVLLPSPLRGEGLG